MTSGILFDGWSLVYHPNNPEALHLLALLEMFPQDFRAVIAMPGETIHTLPVQVECISEPRQDTSINRLFWEQIKLSNLARQADTSLVHLTAMTPALFSRKQTLVSPAGWQLVPGIDFQATTRKNRGHPDGLVERIRDALARGGVERLTGLVLPEDSPRISARIPSYRLPPIVHPLFFSDEMKGTISEPALLDRYVLYQGQGTLDELNWLFECWELVTASIGDDIQMILVGLDESAQNRALILGELKQLQETIKLLPALPIRELAKLYHNSTIVFCPGFSPVWEGSLRIGIACEKPVVALETSISDAIAGPAAYLVPDDSFHPIQRAFSAALLTILIEEQVSDGLIDLARKQKAGWQFQRFQEQIAELYTLLLSL